MDHPQPAEVYLPHLPGGVSSIRTVVLLCLLQLRLWMKRRSDWYDTGHPRPSSNSWMRVTNSRSPVSHWWIWSAQGASRSSLGVSA